LLAKDFLWNAILGVFSFVRRLFPSSDAEVGPFSRLTYLAISRKREYLADSNGAYLTRNPEGLAKALEKIKNDMPQGKPKGSKTVAPLYIANPFKHQTINSIWATHPPLDERVRRLRAM